MKLMEKDVELFWGYLWTLFETLVLFWVHLQPFCSTFLSILSRPIEIRRRTFVQAFCNKRPILSKQIEWEYDVELVVSKQPWQRTLDLELADNEIRRRTFVQASCNKRPILSKQMEWEYDAELILSKLVVSKQPWQQTLDLELTDNEIKTME